MALPIWHPPVSRWVDGMRGEDSNDLLYFAVGQALNEWERLESTLAFLFGRLCESHSIATRRAYGTSGRGRKNALEAAIKEFFRDRDDAKRDNFDELLKEYSKASEYRNHLAHGICNAIVSSADHSGWFLCRPQYVMKGDRQGIVRQGITDADYVYRASHIGQCYVRFGQLADEAGLLDSYLAKAYPD
jgi:hypothetical protein